MKHELLDCFAPELRIVKVDDQQIVVTFDSQCQLDKTRAALATWMPRPDNLGFKLTGFEQANVYHDQLLGHQTIRGDINLVSGSETYKLADVTLVLGTTGKSKAKATGSKVVYEFQRVEDIASLVRQGVSDALTAALNEYLDSLSPGASTAGTQIQPSIAPVANGAKSPQWLSSYRDRSTAARGTSKSVNGRKIALAVVAVPLVLMLVLVGGARILKPSNPIEDAVAKAMRQDPASVNSQIELTKQTLAQMGLDPGQGSDIGCLAK
jgi:hypothetical protein